MKLFVIKNNISNMTQGVDVNSIYLTSLKSGLIYEQHF